MKKRLPHVEAGEGALEMGGGKAVRHAGLDPASTFFC
jgi:hypothetical protein